MKIIKKILEIPLRFSAFTLAEVLLTIGIIGVIAAIIIPTVMNYVQIEIFRSSLKKQYSALSQAVNALQAQNGSIDMSSANNFIKDLSKQMSIAKQGTWGSLTTLPSNYYYHCYKNNSGTCGNFLYAPTWSNNSAFITKDGVFYINRTGPYANCDGGNWYVRIDPSEVLPMNNKCIEFAVDLNGDNGPNQLGMDLHNFYLLKENNYYYIRPTGALVGTNCSSASPDNAAGSLDCTNRMLLDMPMP